MHRHAPDRHVHVIRGSDGGLVGGGDGGCHRVVRADRLVGRVPHLRAAHCAGHRRRGAGPRARRTDHGRPAPEGGHPADHPRRPRGSARGLGRVDDRGAGDDRHALPQRRRRHLDGRDGPAATGRRGHREPGRPDLTVAPRPAARRRGHPRAARPDDLRVPGLRAAAVLPRRIPRRPLPIVDAAGTDRRRRGPADALPAGHELGLRAHQLRHPRTRVGADHRHADGRADRGAGARAARPDGHRRPRHTGHPGAGRCTPSPRNGERCWACRMGDPSTRSPRSGTRRGRSPTARSRP